STLGVTKVPAAPPPACALNSATDFTMIGLVVLPLTRAATPNSFPVSEGRVVGAGCVVMETFTPGILCLLQRGSALVGPAGAHFSRTLVGPVPVGVVSRMTAVPGCGGGSTVPGSGPWVWTMTAVPGCGGRSTVPGSGPWP